MTHLTEFMVCAPTNPFHAGSEHTHANISQYRVAMYRFSTPVCFACESADRPSTHYENVQFVVLRREGPLPRALLRTPRRHSAWQPCAVCPPA
jgi:hypothetical protein